MQPRVLLDGLAMPESPRWHDGRLWFSNWGTGQIVAVDLDGNSEVVGEGPDGLGWATNWLPDGRMLDHRPGAGPRRAGRVARPARRPQPHLAVRMERADRRRARQRLREHDQLRLRPLRRGAAKRQAPGKIALVTPDGEAREVAGGIAFPNGMVITPDNGTLVVAESFAARLDRLHIGGDGTLSNRRVWADGVGPDGICLDADGCIWASSGAMVNDCARIREGGEVLERFELDRPCFAAMLGGPDRRTLFMLTAEWHGTEGIESVVRARTGQVLVVDAPAPGVGWP